VRRALARAGSAAYVATTGIGPLAAESAASAVLAERRPARVVVTGLCGVLSPAFRVGDALVYREIVTPEERFAFDRELSGFVADRVAGSQSGIRAIASGVIVTRSADKLALGERYTAQAVDMETAAVARRLQADGIAVAALRVGSDGAADDLPALDRALDGSGGMDGLALALAMVRQPIAGVRLARNGTRALGALERAVYALFSAR
jgi:nucleoside phosphorylase